MPSIVRSPLKQKLAAMECCNAHLQAGGVEQGGVVGWVSVVVPEGGHCVPAGMEK